MKRIFMTIAVMAICLAVFATNEIPTQKRPYGLENKEDVVNSEYEYVRKVSALEVKRNGSGAYWDLKLYKGIYTCDNYYVGYSGAQYAVRDNSYSTYKGNDVSEYRYLAYGDQGSVYFFNF